MQVRQFRPQTFLRNLASDYSAPSHHASRHTSREGFVRSQVATVRLSFTFFEARSIKFVIVVYSECMLVDGRLALNQL
jgi:hypothetical protein